MDTRSIQARLKELGFDPGAVDGVLGPKTEAAIVAFKRSRGLAARPYIGPVTLAELFGVKARSETVELPWINEVAKYVGLHESRDFTRLFAWLRSDRASVGDPRKFPWCADLVQTAIRLTLPDEPFPGRLGLNPYLARNWMEFGVPTEGRMGAVAVFWRTHRTQSLNGHVGFVIGRDPQRGLLRIRGGNQGNSVSDAWLGEDRLLGFRAPATYPNLPPLPTMNGAGAIISTNEA
jgi:uncharacterized protein (TIGR02594 family)